MPQPPRRLTGSIGELKGTVTVQFPPGHGGAGVAGRFTYELPVFVVWADSTAPEPEIRRK